MCFSIAGLSFPEVLTEGRFYQGLCDVLVYNE